MLDYQVKDQDTGIDDSESIQPYDNAEAADENVFRRTPENLRTRTEVLRDAVDDLRALAGLDRGLTIVASSESTVQWGGAADVDLGSGTGTGIPTLSAPAGAGSGAVNGIAVQGFLSNAKRLNSSGVFSIGDTAIMPKLERSSGAAELAFESLKRPWENGNNIFIRVYDAGAPQTPKAQVTVEGTLDGSGNPSGPVTIHVSVSNDGGIDATCQDVVDQVNAHATAQALVTASTGAGTEAAFEIKDATDSEKGVPLEGGVDSESFAILESTWNSFFAGDNLLNEGDVVVFAFADADARRSQGGSPESTLRVMRNSEIVDINNVVPICKVIQDGLVFINGTGLVRGETVRLIPDQHLRGDLEEDTGASAGDTLVGADSKTNNGATVAQGTVYSQMLSLLGQHGTLDGKYDDHVQGTADQHTIKHINVNSRPFVVVDQDTGDGDYTTISAALTALSSTGGIILVKSGDYGALSTLGGPAADIDIVGESGGSGGVRIQSTDNNYCLSDDGGHSGTVRFHNVQFFADAAGTDSNGCVSLSAQGPVHFNNCFFYKSNNTLSTDPLVVLNRREDIRFTNCKFLGQQTDGAPCFLMYVDSAGEKTRLSVDHCYVSSCDVVVEYGKSGEQDTPHELIFRHNEMYNCGYSSAGGSYTILFKRAVSTAELQLVDIAHNLVYDGATARQPKFCDVKGAGRIAHNVILSPVVNAPSSDEFSMTLEGISNVGQLVAEYNSFPENANIGAAAVGAYAQFKSNIVYTTAPGTTNPIVYVSGDGACVANNRIIHDDTDTNNRKIIRVDAATDVRVEDNLLEGCYRNDPAISIEGLAHRVVVARNTILFKADTGVSYSNSGIKVDSIGASDYPEFGQVLNNTMRNVRNGFDGASNQNCVDWNISGNQMEMENTTVVDLYGIKLDDGTERCRVVNNSVHFQSSTSTGQYGIFFDGVSALIANNQLYHAFHGIDGSGATAQRFVIQGNHIQLNDADNAIGVDVSNGTQVTRNGAIVGNFVNAGSGATPVAYDLEGCDEIGVGGNIAVPYNVFSDVFKTDGNSADLGMSKNPALADLDDKNFYTESI